MTGSLRRPAKKRPALPLGIVLLLGAACSYGPDEERIDIAQIVRVGDSFQALIVVRYDRLRVPTGINAFPDGGRALILERRGRLYLVDASERRVSLLVEEVPSDDIWAAYGMSVRGLVGDSVAYVASTGCARGGECYPGLDDSLILRASLEGPFQVVSEVPSEARLPGVMLARRPGEESYVRFSSDRSFVTARFEEGASFEPVFEVLSDGSLVAVGG